MISALLSFSSADSSRSSRVPLARRATWKARVPAALVTGRLTLSLSSTPGRVMVELPSLLPAPSLPSMVPEVPLP
ncbi:hypothetical protein D3C72_2371740 [compost metagenome]